MAEIPNRIRLIQHGAAHTATDMRARLAIRLKEIYPFRKQAWPASILPLRLMVCPLKPQLGCVYEVHLSIKC
jgi:hypothetical protein